MKLFAAMLAVCSFFVTSLVAGQFGTGFAVSPKGYLVTCHHVIRGADRVMVHLPGGPIPAIIVALDPANDLAILKIDEWNGRTLGLASSSEAHYGSPITAAGFPDPTVLGKLPKISTGVVNALSGVRDDPRLLQISSPVQPGNSGGPVISQSGRVVGVVASGLNSIERMKKGGYVPQSVNFAVKTELILPLLAQSDIKVPIFRTKTKDRQKQIARALNSIVLIESLDQGKAPTRLLQQKATNMGGNPPQPVLTPISPSEHRVPWVFPNSHARALSISEVRTLHPHALWRARNEIYLRRGFQFTTPEGQHFAQEYGTAYQPRTTSVEAVQRQLTQVEIANLQLIAAQEQAAN